jgi:hypothetical protein
MVNRGVVHRVALAAAMHLRLSTWAVFCAVWIAFLLLPLPTTVKGGRTILVPRALLNQYITAYRQHGLDISPSPVERFTRFFVIHLALAALATTLVALRLGKSRTKHVR